MSHHSPSAEPATPQPGRRATALVPRRVERRLPAPPPEVVIELPARPPRKRLWLLAGGIGGLLLLLILLAVWWLAIRPQRLANAALEATVQALVFAQQTDAQPLAPATPHRQNPAASAPTASPAQNPPADPSAPAEAAPARQPVFGRPATALLNVRSGPGPDYPVLFVIDADTRLHLLGRSPETGEDGWLLIATDSSIDSSTDSSARSFADGSGWVAAWLVELSGDPQELAVFPAPPLPTAPSDLPDPQPPDPQPTVPAAAVLPTATPTAPPSQPTPTAAPPPAAVGAGPANPCAAEGALRLLEPVAQAVHDQVTFRWYFGGALPQGCGFEVSLWRTGEARRGVHDAVADWQAGNVKLTSQNEYRLTIPYLHDLPSVRGRAGEYNWTVALVQVQPVYRPTGHSAPPAWFYVDGPSGGSE